MTVKAILTDIEGTTSSIDFVHQVLFPYAAREIPAYLRDHPESTQVVDILNEVRREAGEPDADGARVTEILLGWIAEDRKVTALKALQGLVWAHGYKRGDYTGHIYTDAEAWLRKWHDNGIGLYVFSSGSVLAQKLLFGHSDAGDLCPLFNGYFDTQVGHKGEVDAYRRIAREIGLLAEEILFRSDVVNELNAAAAAGMRTTQLVRSEGMETGQHPVAHAFDEVVLN